MVGALIFWINTCKKVDVHQSDMLLSDGNRVLHNDERNRSKGVNSMKA